MTIAVDLGRKATKQTNKIQFIAHSLPGTFRSCFSFEMSFFMQAVCNDVSPGIDIKKI